MILPCIEQNSKRKEAVSAKRKKQKKVTETEQEVKRVENALCNGQTSITDYASRSLAITHNSPMPDLQT